MPRSPSGISQHPASSELSKPLVALVIAVGAVAYASLGVGFVSDDAIYSLEAGQDQAWSFIVKHTLEMMRTGRFLPVHFPALVSTWVATPIVFRIVSLLGVVLAATAFAACLRSLAELSFETIPAIAALCLLSLQIRTYHDPVLSFGLLIPLVIGLSSTAALSLSRFLVSESKAAGLTFIVCWSLGLMTYEVCLGFLPLLLWLVYEPPLAVARRRAARLKALLMVLVPALAFAIASSLVRRSADANYAGVTENIDLRAAVRAAVFQVAGSLPLVTREISRLNFDGTWLCLFVTLSLSIWLMLPKARLSMRLRGTVFLVLSFVLPGLALAFSSKYQSELRLGVAYLPVLLSSFAVGSVTLVLLSFVPQWARVASIVGMGAMLASVWRVNVGVARFVESQFTTPRSELGAFLRSLPKDALNPSDIVVVAGSHDLEMVQPGWAWYSWESPRFFRQFGHRVSATLCNGWYRDELDSSVLVRGQELSIAGNKTVLLWSGVTEHAHLSVLVPVELKDGALYAQKGRRWCVAWLAKSESSAAIRFSETLTSRELSPTGDVSCFESGGEPLREITISSAKARVALELGVASIGPKAATQ